jgi:nitrate/TMAO reductase-like tetraheme cytochrome c subunit
MQITRWKLVALLLVAVIIGAGGMLTSVWVNHYTSTEEFCTSCHTMKFVSDDPHFQRSAHRTNKEGVRPTCAQCHIPTTNWFQETYVHVTSGLRDVFYELTGKFSDPKAWEAGRAALEEEAHADIRGWDSVTCRSCHNPSAIQPKTDEGRQAHAMLSQGGVTCVDCHTNLVHPPATKPEEPTTESK